MSREPAAPSLDPKAESLDTLPRLLGAAGCLVFVLIAVPAAAGPVTADETAAAAETAIFDPAAPVDTTLEALPLSRVEPRPGPPPTEVTRLLPASNGGDKKVVLDIVIDLERARRPEKTAATAPSTDDGVAPALAALRHRAPGHAPLAIGDNPVFGTAVPDGAACVADGGPTTQICLQAAAWPEDLASLLAGSGPLYRGTKVLIRYRDGRAERAYGLFPAAHFETVAIGLGRIFGGAEIERRPMALIGDPGARNTVVRWTRPDGDGGRIVLELRRADDLRDMMPDQANAVIRLFREDGAPMFPDLATTDFLIRAAGIGR